MLENEIRQVFSEHPDIIYGFTDISYSPYRESYHSALVFAVPYGEQLTPDDYTEERFEQGIQTARSRLEIVVAEIEMILQKHQTKYWIPPVAQENEAELRALFSFKTAAAHAGIGWFGKNDVIITERYGPRVRLSAVLIDEKFTYGRPITAGRCPESCTKCIDICPCKALKNQQWTIEKDRSEIIDYQKCNRMRSAFIRKLGRKSACGLCLAVCPFGRAESDQNRKLTIRKMNEQDLKPLHALLSDPDVMFFLEPPYSIEQTRSFLQAALSDAPPVYAVDLGGAFIGYVIYHPYDENSMEIGWVLTPEQWGKGYASALTEQMAEKARSEGKSLVIECDPGQEITKHIAVRHGFVRSGAEDGLEIYRLS